MKLTQNFKRILSAMLVLIMVFSMVPVSAQAAGTESPLTAAIFFSDVHGLATSMTPVLNKLSNIGVSYETVGLVGDTFSGSTGGTTASMTSTIQGILNPSVTVRYAWGANDKYSDIANTSGLLYGGEHYYIYHISEADMNANYGSDVTTATNAFLAAVENMDKTKVLFIMSHLPLHSSVNYSDNTYAINWYTAISQAANTMDVVFFWGHNTNEAWQDTDAYYLPNTGGSGFGIGNSGYKYPNFTYMNAGYIDGAGQNPGREGVATIVKIYANTMVFQDYTADGEFINSASHNVTVTRKFAPKPHEHKYESQTVAATCTKDGSTTYTCSCGDSYTETIPAIGHNYVETLCIDPTCLDTGSITYTCSRCSDSYTEELPAWGHWFETITTDATCTEDGSIVSVCFDCGELEAEPQVIPATGHNYVTTTTDATCTKDGSIVTACTNCGDTTQNDVIPALGHDYTTSVLYPSCTRYGYTKYTCKTCRYYYYTDETAPTGHKYTTIETPATCTEDGYITSKCTGCSNSMVTGTIPALGHSYTGVENGDNTVTYTCGNCQISYDEVIVSNHTYKKVTKFTTDDTFVITMYSNKNYYALCHKDNMITVVPVTVSGGKITSTVSEDMLWGYNSKRLYYTDDELVCYLTTESASLFGTPTLSIDTSGPATVSFSSSKLKVGSYYLRFSNNVVSLERNATTTYLFKLAD